VDNYTDQSRWLPAAHCSSRQGVDIIRSANRCVDGRQDNPAPAPAPAPAAARQVTQGDREAEDAWNDATPVQKMTLTELDAAIKSFKIMPVRSVDKYLKVCLECTTKWLR
jgi:hypothetical protein